MTAVGLLLFAGLVAYVAITHSDEEGHHRGHTAENLPAGAASGEDPAGEMEPAGAGPAR